MPVWNISHDTSNLRRSESSRARAVYLRPRNSFAQNLAFSSDTISPGFQFPISDSTAIASFDVKPIPCRSSNKSGLSTTSWLRQFPRKELYRPSTHSVTCNKNTGPLRYLSSSYLRNVAHRLRALDSLKPKNWSVSTLSKKIGISGALEKKGWLSNQDRPMNLWKPGLLPASTLTGQFWMRKMFVTLSDNTNVLEFAAAIVWSSNLALQFIIDYLSWIRWYKDVMLGMFLIWTLSILNDVSVIAGCKNRLFMLTAEVALNNLTQIHRVSLKEWQGADIVTLNTHVFHCRPAISVNTLIPMTSSWVMTIARCRAHSISILMKYWKKSAWSIIDQQQAAWY